MARFATLVVPFLAGWLLAPAVGLQTGRVGREVDDGSRRPVHASASLEDRATSPQAAQAPVAPAGLRPVRFRQGQCARAIPYSLVDDVPVVEAKLNGGVTVRLLLDTGFGSRAVLLFDPDLARQLNLKTASRIRLGGAGGQEPRTVDTGGVVELSLPGVSFSSVPTLVASEKRFFEDWPCDGIVGGTLFSDCLVEIDTASGHLSFCPRDTALPDNPGEPFDLTFSHGIPVVEGQATLGGQTMSVNLLVDSGAALPFILFSYSSPALKAPAETITFKGEGINGVASVQLGRIPSVRVGPYIIREALAGFMSAESMGAATNLGQHGFLGPQTLQKFHVLFDYPGKRMYLRPNVPPPAEWEFNMAGLALKTLPTKRVMVFDVVAGSPAARVQIQPGDLILTIDGKPVEGLSYLDVYGSFIREGKAVSLVIERGTQRMARQVVLKRLI